MTTQTFSELYQSVITDLRNRLSLTTIVGKVALNAIALVQAAKLKLYYLSAEFVYKNIFPDQADSEDLGGTLSRFGYVKLGRYPNAATAGEYECSITGTTGATIASGTTFKSMDSSTNPDYVFILDSAYTFTSSTGTITLRALTAGTESELSVDDELQVTSPLSNVDSYATVTSVSTEPEDAEDTDEYREKVIQGYQEELEGGAKTDYRNWAFDVDVVKWTNPQVGTPGEINLYVEVYAASSTDGHGTPTSAILEEVAEVIEYDPDTTKADDERGRRPMGTFQVNVLPINPVAVDVVITNLSDTSYLTSIESAIEELLEDIRPYVDGADAPTDSQKGKLYEADIYTTVRDILGSDATFDSLTVAVDGDLISTYTFEDDNIPYLNSVTNE